MSQQPTVTSGEQPQVLVGPSDAQTVSSTDMPNTAVAPTAQVAQPAPPPVETQVKRDVNGKPKPKRTMPKTRNADLQTASSSMAARTDPVYLKPALHRFPRLLECTAAHMKSYLRKDDRPLFLEDLKRVFLHNAHVMLKERLALYVPEGNLEKQRVMAMPHSAMRALEAIMPLGPTKDQVVPPLLPHRGYVMEQLAVELGVGQPNALTLSELIGRWSQYESVLAKSGIHFVQQAPGSLLNSGVTANQEAPVEEREYRTVGHTHYSRMDELLAGFLRLRAYELIDGVYQPSFVDTEWRALPQLLVYYGSGHPVTETDFVYEFISADSRQG